MKKSGKSFEIALSAISCAFATLCLTLACYFPPLYTAGLFLATLFLTIPLSKGFLLGGALSFVASSILSFLFGGCAFFFELLPFFVFLGLHPLVNTLQKKSGKLPALWYLLKTIWFVGALFLCWKFSFSFTLPWVGETGVFNRRVILVITLAGSVLFLIYDQIVFACQRALGAILRKLGR